MWTIRKLYNQLSKEELDYELHVQSVAKNNGKFQTGFDVISDKVDFVDIFGGGKVIRLGVLDGG